MRIPKLRTGSFFPSLLERRRRIDQVLFAVVMEAYMHGVSTRQVDDLVKALGADTGISKSEVSRISKDLTGLIAHHDHGSQYLSVAHTEHLAAAGINPSTGAVGSSYDNAPAESVIGLYKTELIKPRRPWTGFDDLEIATAEWVDWFNHRRPFEYCDYLTPVEAEEAHYAHHKDPATVGSSN